MRITGGDLRGRALAAPSGSAVRPTSDKVRQAIFNILAHNDFDVGFALQGARVVDLFAGTGAMGIEAISRGARFCLFVEEAAEARALIRRNVEAFGLTGATKIWRRDATRPGPMAAGAFSREADIGSRQKMRPTKNAAGGPFNLAILDPPYRKALIAPALAALRDGGWLAPNAIVIAECAADENIPSTDGFTVLDDRVYGETRVTFLRAPATRPPRGAMS